MRTAIMLALMIAIAGCNSRDAGNLSQDAGNLVKHTAQAAGSAQLAARVNATLAERKGVDMSGLHVEALDGVVTIGGHVRNEAERKRVVDTVDSIRGVDKVIDHLRIQK